MEGYMDYEKLDYGMIDQFFLKGELSILAGIPFVGKTFFVNHLTQVLAQHGERVLYFCLEPYTTEQKERLDSANIPPRVVDIPASSIEDVLYLVNQKKYDALVIDYVQLMDFVSYIHCFTRDEELKAIWHILDDLAKEKEIRVIGVSQLGGECTIDGSEETIPEDCMEYLNRDFLAKHLRVIHRPNYFKGENDTEAKQPIHLITHFINSPSAYPTVYL